MKAKMDTLGESSLKNFTMDIEGPTDTDNYTLFLFEGQDYKAKQKGS